MLLKMRPQASKLISIRGGVRKDFSKRVATQVKHIKRTMFKISKASIFAYVQIFLYKS